MEPRSSKTMVGSASSLLKHSAAIFSVETEKARDSCALTSAEKKGMFVPALPPWLLLMTVDGEFPVVTSYKSAMNALSR